MIAILPNGKTHHEGHAPTDPGENVLETVSTSRLNCFHTCRLKFYFRYILRLKKPSTVALHVGKAVHAVLQEWSKARWRGWAQPIFREVFDEAWRREQADNPVRWEDKELTQKESAWSLVELYLKETPVPADEKPQGVEVKVETDLGHRGLPKLVGIMDLVRPSPYGGVIVDFKTSAVTPSPDRVIHTHETQLSCYSVLYRDATGQDESGFELHHLVKTKAPKLVVTAVPPMTPSQEARLYRAMESYVTGVQREDFIPSPSIGCLSCEYFRECRNWGG